MDRRGHAARIGPRPSPSQTAPHPLFVLRCAGAAAALACAAAAVPATDFTVLHQFDKTHGGMPCGQPVPDNQGNLNGTTHEGGKSRADVQWRLTGSRADAGTVYRIRP